MGQYPLGQKENLVPGSDMAGEVVAVPVGDQLVAVEIGGTVLVDPEGARRDG